MKLPPFVCYEVSLISMNSVCLPNEIPMQTLHLTRYDTPVSWLRKQVYF